MLVRVATCRGNLRERLSLAACSLRDDKSDAEGLAAGAAGEHSI